jgi:hypothetical protein
MRLDIPWFWLSMYWNCPRRQTRRTGCYIDTLNPYPSGTKLRRRLIHHDEILEALGTVVYKSPSLGMGIAFTDIPAQELIKLDRWLFAPQREF